MGIMYIEQKMYYMNKHLCETIMIQKNRFENDLMWILGPGSLRVIGHYEFQMQASTVVLANQNGTFTFKCQMLQI